MIKTINRHCINISNLFRMFLKRSVELWNALKFPIMNINYKKTPPKHISETRDFLMKECTAEIDGVAQ
jgi:hypothetical protein